MKLLAFIFEHPSYKTLFGVFNIVDQEKIILQNFSLNACSYHRSRLRHNNTGPGHVAQVVRCLATDGCLTADPGVMSLIPARSHTFVEIDHEIISAVIILPSAESFKMGCCELQAKVCARSTG